MYVTFLSVSTEGPTKQIPPQSVQDHEKNTVHCWLHWVQSGVLQEFCQTGDTFSSHTNTFKYLIAVTPNGGACFISDLLQGDIDDVRIFDESGIMKHLKPYDLVLADRGFTVHELLNPLQVELKIPAFLKGRKSLSAAEELETRRIAKARIHVERFNERLKQFKLVGRKMPLSIAPLATQWL